VGWKSLAHHNAMNITSFILPGIFGLLLGLLLQLHVLLLVQWLIG
jgi:hypothetical protein